MCVNYHMGCEAQIPLVLTVIRIMTTDICQLNDIFFLFFFFSFRSTDANLYCETIFYFSPITDRLTDIALNIVLGAQKIGSNYHSVGWGKNRLCACARVCTLR